MPPTKRRTLGEVRYRKRPDLTTIRKWITQFSSTMLASVWKGFDLFTHEVLTFNPNQAEDDLERTITEWLDPRIRKFIDDHAPYYLQPNTGERGTRKPAPAMPPQYDLAFVFWEHEEMKWPLEAKVLKTDSTGSIGEYVATLKEKFLTCTYAPFSSEAAMIGYLFSGNPDVAFANIAARVPCHLKSHPEFGGRNHKVSTHVRTVPPEKRGIYPARFRCHHLLMQIKEAGQTKVRQPMETGWLFS